MTHPIAPETPKASTSPKASPSDVAIVGMSAIVPGAGTVAEFWANTLKGVDAITEIPADRWDWRLYYDADPKAPDKIISKWGGFVPDVPFDPIRYGMPPSSLPSIEPVQLLLLEATRAAIDDAGYAERPFDRERTAVVLGMGGGAAQLAMGYAFRSYLPMLDAVRPGLGAEALEDCRGLLPEWTEDSFPGFLLNVAAGRVANRFDLGGANYTVDAACGSSLAAASLAVRELESGAADVVILGGADTVQNPFTYLAFSKTQAFSPRGRCRPFDASADGIVISEGVAVVILKRLADAERDGDRIYAVIKGMGASSDGRARGLTAPGLEGQVRAVERAYARAGVDPKTIGYVEAHGTGTAVGDVVEVNAISRVFRESGASRGSVAIGSVKSMIGHTKCAAGLAGLINASLALHQRTLPPTIGLTTVNPRADLLDGPFAVNTQARPWLHSSSESPRRAGVSAFGFGGTNFHAVLEEYPSPLSPAPIVRDRSAELFLWSSPDRSGLLSALEKLIQAIDDGARPRLVDLARAVNARERPPGGPTLAIVAGSIEDLREKLNSARAAIDSDAPRFEDRRGIFFDHAPRFRGQPLAFLFPGQGSQAPGMLLDLAMTFPEITGAFDAVDAALVKAGRPAVGPFLYPLKSPEVAAQALRATDRAQPALAGASAGLLRLYRSLGIEPDVVAGHSFGELVALHAAGSLSLEGLAELASVRGRLMVEALGAEPGQMAAVAIEAETVASWLVAIDGVAVVNENGPRQTVVAGTDRGIAQVIERTRAEGIAAKTLDVAGAFHTARLNPATLPLARAVADRLRRAPDRAVYSNLDAGLHPDEAQAIADRMGEHVARPVRFASMVEAMYRDGVRVFVEVGPGSVLTSLVGSILGDRPHLALASETPGRPGLPTLLRTLGQLAVAGVGVDLDRLTRGRADQALDLDHLPLGDGSPPPSATTWLVNGSRSRPIDQPEPRRLGQGAPLLSPLPARTQPGTTREPLIMPAPPKNGSTNGHHPLDAPILGKAATPPARTVASPVDDRVLASFQETMRAFLDVQRSTMLAYLGARPSPVEPTLAAPIRPTPDPLPEILAARSRPVAPTAPTPPVALAPEPSPAPDSGREAVTARLVEIVRDRTGYPTEMLGLDLDLEADLGIDSIKRVEILGSLRDALPDWPGADEPESMDALSRARTLGAIVDRVVAADRKPKAPAGIKPQATADRVEVRRMVLEAVDAPPAGERSGLMPGGLVVVTDDGRGVARALARELEASGHPVILAGRDEVDFESPGSVEGLLELARSSGRIAAIVHALPLRDAARAGLDPRAWAGRMGPEVKGLFHLAKAAAGDLDQASASGGGALVVASAMGGRLAIDPGDLEFFPGHGGLTGLAKTLAREWPDARTRVVDFDPTADPDEIAERLRDEVLTDDDWSEVGYRGDQRIRLAARVSPLDRGIPPLIDLKPGEPILVTGGARGITATVVEELARAWRPTLLLLGRNPLPSEIEDSETARIEAPSELKAVLHARLRRQGKAVTPALLDRQFQGTLQSREIRRNLARFRELGAVVEYAPVEVRDADALAPILGAWRTRFGPPVGFVHGAGVIKDKLIRDKTPETFDHVLGTKLDGALNLARLLDPASLRFAAFFSSIAGRFGNVGQSDYAAANDVLNKLAAWLDRRWSARVVAMNWGPWSGVGMVSELEGHLNGRGLGMISPEAGRSLLLDELRFGRKGTVEVIASGNLGTLDGPVGRPRFAEAVR